MLLFGNEVRSADEQYGGVNIEAQDAVIPKLILHQILFQLWVLVKL